MVDFPLRFDFGTAEAQEGWKKVSDNTAFDTVLGYGFEKFGFVYAKERGEPQDIRRDFCIPLGAAFSCEVPNGNYIVTVVIGDTLASTHTTIKEGKRRLMLPNIRTLAGQFARCSFAVSTTSGLIRLQFSGTAPRINSLEIADARHTATLFLAGDSTVTDEEEGGYPYTGWGQMLPCGFKPDIAVSNHAMSGRSSKSFIEEGRLEAIWAAMKPHDYLLIQFGHNDQKFDEQRYTEPFTTYKEYLLQYIEGARERGGLPILVTPVQRRYFNADGSLADTHGDYVVAMKELAVEKQVPLIDLAEKSRSLFERLGPTGTQNIFMWTCPGEYEMFPHGSEDNTHFQEQGATEIAGLVLEGLRELNLQPLRMYLK
ncbi:MAG: GDSL family lipase [Paenibacillus sp.]|nr:GDSL family lipase [Paenibacillus sp.]